MASSRVRARKFEFFLDRWGVLYDWVTGNAAAARDGAAALEAAKLGRAEAARLAVTLRKAARARDALKRLQECDRRHAELEARVGALARAELPRVKEELRALDAEAAAAAQRRRPALVQKQQEQPLVQQQEQQQQPEQQQPEQQQQQPRPEQPPPPPEDPFGVAAALGRAPTDALALASWRSARRAVAAAADAAERLLAVPSLDALARFNAERRELVRWPFFAAPR